MIHFVRGLLTEVGTGWVVVDLGGIGLKLAVPASTTEKLPEIGKTVLLLTELQVKQDGISLYGFLTEDELNLFHSLTSVNGVGPRVALGIMSGAPAREIISMICSGDANSLQRLPGVGKKIAERLVVELREKLRDKAVPAGPARTDHAELIEGLMALGYNREEASRALEGALKALPKGAKENADELMASALRLLGRQEVCPFGRETSK
ncbi:MAG TPA: Holliday junction branch migration protein RuvA [Firmicutes bacterium]|nr:Holliday junction branch migration protein RuvA [Bacillota bacterium]